ncbi:MAG TPA: hydrogenase maturation nickel metallochaperone HypA [Chloroflexota bacterium]|nr:hydrogenase maturation nickel metallochaperone HypA [Chloroflexota bacterium]
MHELAITESILQIATDEAKRVGATQVKLIRLKVGAMSQVVPDAVQYYLDLLSPGTIAEGVKLEAITIPIGATCPNCSESFVVENYDLACPRCGGTGKITQGRELSVESIEVEK